MAKSLWLWTQEQWEVQEGAIITVQGNFSNIAVNALGKCKHVKDRFNLIRVTANVQTGES